MSAEDKKGLPRVFVSYSRRSPEQYLFIKQLIARLDDQLFDPWDFETLEGEISLGDIIDQACLDQIDQADIFIPIVTEAALSSKYVAMEIEHALDRKIGLCVAPIVMTGSRNWDSPFSDLRSFKCHTVLSKALGGAAIGKEVELTVESLCNSQSIDYIPPEEDAHRLPLLRNLLIELEEVGATTGEVRQQVDFRQIYSFCTDLASEITDDDYHTALVSINIVCKTLKRKQFFPHHEFYYPQIVKAVVETNLAKGDPDKLSKAQALFQQLIDDEHPKLDANAYTGVGNIALLLGEYNIALENYDIAMNMCPQDPACFHNLIIARIALQLPLDKREIYRRVDKLADGVATKRPGDLKRMALALVYALVHCDDLIKAKELWSNIGEIDADESDLIVAMVQQLFGIAEQNEDEYAIQVALEFIDVFLDRAEKISTKIRNNLLNTRGWIKSYLGDTQAALDVFKCLANDNPEHIRYLTDAAILFLHEKKKREAEVFLIKATGLTIQNDKTGMTAREFLYYLGLAHWLSGCDAKAQAFYEQSELFSAYYDVTNSWVTRLRPKGTFSLFRN